MGEAWKRSGEAGEELTRMTLLEHLEELRRRLAWSIAAILVGFLLCWVWAPPIFAWLSGPIPQFLPPGEKLAFTGLVDPFMLYMKVALLAGIFLASPVILYQFWLFVSPALYRHERHIVVPFVAFTTVFFLGGGYFGYKVAFPPPPCGLVPPPFCLNSSASACSVFFPSPPSSPRPRTSPPNACSPSQ